VISLAALLAAPVIVFPPAVDPVDQTHGLNQTPGYAGTADPGATVTMTVDGAVAGTATADADGTWVARPATPLGLGEHSVVAQNGDDQSTARRFRVTSTEVNPEPFTFASQGRTGPATTTSTDVTLTLPATSTACRALGTITGAIDGQDQVTATTDGQLWTVAGTLNSAEVGAHHVLLHQVAPGCDGIWTVSLTLAPHAPVITAPTGVTADPDPVITGTGRPDAIVAVTVDGVPAGTTQVDDDNTWSLAAPRLAEGTHAVVATQQLGGAVSQPSQTGWFTVAVPPVITTPANATLTNDPTPTFGGTAPPGARVTVLVDGAPTGTAPAGADGRWTVTSGGLPDGTHTAHATQNNSATSAPVSLTIDATAPAAPVITEPAQNGGTGPRPTVAGVAEPGATVVAQVDGIALGVVTAESDGRWVVVVDRILDPGTHVVSAQQSDAAANTSPPAATAFTSAAAPPAITAPADGVVLTAVPAEITGTGHPGAEVNVSLNGQPIGQATVSEPPAGTTLLAATEPDPVRWAVPVPEQLAEGVYTTVATERFKGETVGSTTTTFTIAAVAVAPAAHSDSWDGVGGLLVGIGLAGVTLLVVLLRRRRIKPGAPRQNA
jgi:hypothetical protein